MKYVILIGDGMADYPIPELDNRTPLTAARTPNMDFLATEGELGLARTVPEGMEPGSDVANLSIMGYDPARYHTGRAPLEAASMGVALEMQDVAFRCNLVTLRHEPNGDIFMEDYSAGHISSAEAKEIIISINQNLGNGSRRFYPGVSYRHLLVWRDGQDDWRTFPPHDLTGQNVRSYLTGGGREKPLLELMRSSWPLLANHEVNRRRRERSQKPATSIWLWGQGRAPKTPTLQELYGLTGAVISAVDLMRGIGIYAGLTPVIVPGATGYLDTNYAGKVEAALEALKTMDFVYLHVEAPDEAGHTGELKNKLQAIEDFDQKVVGPMLRGLRLLGAHRILLMPDHRTPLCLKTHSPEPVPFVLYDSRKPRGNYPRGFDESTAEATGLLVDRAHLLLPRLLER
ncbi:MAG TPA: cofactor-independent phosphoglycerate mutase [Desulfobacterales bacterium]|nr:cofactor-independent phosphoglycerate mutase [Desulfobacterales bacterium]